MEYTCAWKDIAYVDEELESLDFEIRCGSRVLYRGVAKNTPNMVLTVYLNRFVETCLNNTIDLTERGVVLHPEAVRNFQLYEVPSNRLLAEYNILYNWDYETERDANEKIELTNQINNHMDPRMLILWTAFRNAEESETIEY